MTQPYTHLADRASSTPDALALAGIGFRVTYGELDENVRKVAARMRLLGVEPGQIVGIALPAQLEAVFALAAAHEAVISCTVPASADTPARLGFDWIFATAGRARGAGATSVVTVDSEWLAAATEVRETPDPRSFSSDDDVCRLVFSSGTTGTPKAVPFTITNADYRTASAREHWMGLTPFMSLLGIGTVSGFQTFYASIVAGATYIVSGTPQENLALMREYRVASIKASPIQLDALVNAMMDSPTYLPDLERIQSAGSFLPSALAERLAHVFDCEVVNLYGSSESGTVSVRRGAGTDPQDVGRVVHDMEVQVVDSLGTPVQAGETGLIRYRRRHQAAGYFRDADASAAHFRDGWFYPGDRATLSVHGDLRVEGRASEVLNASGAKIDPIVLEAHALGYEGIRDAAAFMSASASGVERVALAFVSDEEPDVKNLAAHLRELLGGSAPLVFFRVDRIPRNEMGKILRRELAQSHAALVS